MFPHDFGTTVHVTAVSANGYALVSWGGDLSGSGSTNPTTLLMDGDKTITATFVLLPTYTVTIDPIPTHGSIELDPPGGEYSQGVVTVTAIPANGYVFDSWSGDLSGSVNPTTLLMDSNNTISASFQ